MLRKLGLLVLGVVVGAALAVPAMRIGWIQDRLTGGHRAALPASRPPSRPSKPAPPSRSPEEAYLSNRYGPAKNSQFLEEWIARDFFHDRRKGVFVDVGAADYRAGSNTWYLEHELEWSGVAVDAQDRYRADWGRYRPKSTFFTAFVSDRSSEKVRLFLSRKEPFVASSQEKWTEGWGMLAGSVEVPTVTLNDLLTALHVRAFDFLSMDIELAEPKALAGFDVRRFKPALVCVEAYPETRQQILDYFATRRYSVIGKYLRVDTQNLWFMPQGTKVEPFALQAAASR